MIGAAAKEHHLAANDIVVAGSPGMLVGDASDLGVGKEHVWSEAAGSDPVPYIGRDFLGGWKWGVDTYHGIPYNVGRIAVDNTLRPVQGKKVEQTVKVPVKVVTQQNVAGFSG